MSEDLSFRDLIRRVQAGDADACTELVQRYEQAIRVAVSVRLTDPALRRRFDSMDVCQSVWLSFFVRATAGEYRLETPEQVKALLVKIAHNKLINRVAEARAGIRDVRKQADGDATAELADPSPSPSEIVSRRELLEKLLALLSEEERWLWEQRQLGCSWEEIAAEAGELPGTVRMRMRRAIRRALVKLGLQP